MKPDSSSMKSTEASKQASAGFLANSGLAGADPELRHQMIQTAAYYRAERRGFDGGDPGLDWFEAEREVDRMLQGPAGMHAYLARLDVLLTDWDAQYQDLKDKAGDARSEVKAEYKKQLQSLEIERAVIGDKLQKLRRHSGEAWGDLKDSVDKIWDEMHRATKKIAARFKDDSIPSSRKGAR